VIETTDDEAERNDRIGPLTVRVVLPEGWCDYVLLDGVTEEKSGIYEWYIDDVGSYIGKYKKIKRPRKEYKRNVQRILNGMPYRLSRPNRFRRIHRELEKAWRDGRKITLTILENVENDIERHIRERELIVERGILNDPPFGGQVRSPQG
jgi:hypothetical protein